MSLLFLVECAWESSLKLPLSLAWTLLSPLTYSQAEMIAFITALSFLFSQVEAGLLSTGQIYNLDLFLQRECFPF